MQSGLLAAVLMIACVAGCGDRRDDLAAARRTALAAPERQAAGSAAALVCEAIQTAPLPAEVRETSGLARSASHDALFWTHNDAGNPPDLYAIDGDGRLAGRVRVEGSGAVDWEDIESARCGSEACLYIGDIGDNEEDREHITVYRVREPAAGVGELAAEALHARYPDGPKDAEALFTLGQGDLYIVNKGRSGGVALYRWTATAGRAGETAVLERVRTLLADAPAAADRVTAATATPDGRWVGIRTQRTLYLYRAGELVGGDPARPHSFDLSKLREAQGEGLAVADDGSVWLTSEAERGGVPRWSRLQCDLPD